MGMKQQKRHVKSAAPSLHTVTLTRTGAFGDTGSSMTTPLSATKPPASSGASHFETSAGRWPRGALAPMVKTRSAHLQRHIVTFATCLISWGSY